MVFGSFLAKVGKTRLKSADGKSVQINKTKIESLGIWAVGIPHIGLRGRAHAIIDYFNKNISQKQKTKKKIKILDAGCGPGLYGTYFALKGHNVTSLDLDSEKIQAAREINQKAGCESTFIEGDLCDLKFEDNFFDIIICSDVIEHIPNDTKAMKELGRVLKPKGLMLLTTTGNNTFTKKYQKTFEHERAGYDSKEYNDLLNETGLKLVEDQPIFSIFGKAAWLCNRAISKSSIASGILFYPLFWLSHIDYYLKIDYKPFNRLFVTRKDELVKVTEDPFEEIQKPTNNT